VQAPQQQAQLQRKGSQANAVFFGTPRPTSRNSPVSMPSGALERGKTRMPSVGMVEMVMLSSLLSDRVDAAMPAITKVVG
jgi:hypothetical protein